MVKLTSTQHYEFVTVIEDFIELNDPIRYSFDKLFNQLTRNYNSLPWFKRWLTPKPNYKLCAQTHAPLILQLDKLTSILQDIEDSKNSIWSWGFDYQVSYPYEEDNDVYFVSEKDYDFVLNLLKN